MTDPETQTTPTHRTRKRVLVVLRVVVSLGLLAFVLYEMGLGETMQTIRGAHLEWVAVVMVLMLAEGLHGTYKWLILLRHIHKGVGYWTLFKITYISGFLGMFMPGGVGIELVRMYGLTRYTSDLAMSFTSILMDRILGLTGLTLVILAGVVMHGRSEIPGIEYWAIGSLLLILAGWAALMNPAFRRLTDRVLLYILLKVRSFQHKTEKRNTPQIAAPDNHDRRAVPVATRLLRTMIVMVRDKQRKVYASLDTYRSKPGLLAWAMLQSLFYNGIRIAVCYVTGLAVGVEAPIEAYVIAVPVVIFAMMIPISVSGLGVRELLFVQILTAYGATGEKVLAMSLLVLILGTISVLPAAWFCIRGFGGGSPQQQPDSSEHPPATGP